jgi:malate dehydrogenase (oxaloacetate-decarboxylating)
MARQTSRPVVFALSNPTTNSEGTPADILKWSEGRAIVATGSPFPPVDISGRCRVIGQANNLFVFPGVGLGVIIAQASEITDKMFLVAAHELARATPNERLEDGAIFPSLATLRSISRRIAIAVARAASQQGVGRSLTDEQLEETADTAIWNPSYAP